MISNSLEEYLKNMYILKKQNNEIRVTDVAKKMNCSKPSVNKALNNLKEEKLINYETYGKIEITPEGENLARKLLAAYDIGYVFFKDVLGLDEKNSCSEAEKLKSVLEDETINSLAKYVHKVLDFNELECGYDINKERCRCCSRIAIKGHANKQ